MKGSATLLFLLVACVKGFLFNDLPMRARGGEAYRVFRNLPLDGNTVNLHEIGPISYATPSGRIVPFHQYMQKLDHFGKDSNPVMFKQNYLIDVRVH